jgi:hypothetical protein
MVVDFFSLPKSPRCDQGNRPSELQSLKNHLSELLAAYPALQLLTGDAIYAQRPLLELLKVEGCD